MCQREAHGFDGREQLLPYPREPFQDGEFILYRGRRTSMPPFVAAFGAITLLDWRYFFTAPLVLTLASRSR